MQDHGGVSHAIHPFTVTFVCTGNICRSPIAEVVARRVIAEAGLSERVVVNSAGLGEWHIGEAADERAVKVLAERGYDGSGHRGRWLDPQSLPSAELYVAMDRGHRDVLLAMSALKDNPSRVVLMRSFDPTAQADAIVADPFYSYGEAAFVEVLQQIEQAMPGLVEHIKALIDQPTK